ncbi:Peptidyl-prolyl cis-trans isomerase E [Frankliniella fusca]|uniref:Peptidyl-prolyl cis-trans isomerase E n=1 Tax=Frankliniella fusca TaxID=407009 RepID=A0AAE1LU06_9NEOP|nr:Peptidyl-prolyl cis-trans isomerase E [Frankliniella fusca]
MSPNTARKAVADECGGIWGATEPEPSRCHQSNKMPDYDPDNLSKIEALVLCGQCKSPYDDATHLPKDLACKHTFCLECILSGLGKATKGSSVRLGEIFCDLCWKLTELTEKGPQALETNEPKLALVKLYTQLKDGSSMSNGDIPNGVSSIHEASPYQSCALHQGSPLQLWCIDCETSLCAQCQATMHSDPMLHRIWTLEQAKERIVKEAFNEISLMRSMDDNIRQLAKRQRQFLILIRDACTALTTEVQSFLDSEWNVDPTADVRNALPPLQLALMESKSPSDVREILAVILLKKQALEVKCQENIIQCQLNDLIGHSDRIFDFESLRQTVASILSNEKEIKPMSLQQPHPDPILLLTNYCMSQLFSRVHQSQRATGDNTLLNHNMQRQLVITPSEVPVEPTPPPIQTPPQPQPSLIQPVNEASETFNDSVINQVEYSHPNQPTVSVPFDNEVDSQASRATTPTDTNVSTSSSLNNFSPPPATTAQIVQMQSANVPEREEMLAPIIHPPVRPVPNRSPANVSPRYFFHISINGVPKGQIIIETRPDVAPKMCRNFDRLTTADRRASYKNCSFFQCWKEESVITGDYEFNTGRGGKSIYEEGYFQPDETRLPAIRGAVGMRRQQKKHDYFGYVGSQFRIILQEMQGFTGIFGHVVEGIEIVDLIASFGDQTGKPVKPVTITRCGKYAT